MSIFLILLVIIQIKFGQKPYQINLSIWSLYVYIQHLEENNLVNAVKRIFSLILLILPLLRKTTGYDFLQDREIVRRVTCETLWINWKN